MGVVLVVMFTAGTDALVVARITGRRGPAVHQSTFNHRAGSITIIDIPPPGIIPGYS